MTITCLHTATVLSPFAGIAGACVRGTASVLPDWSRISAVCLAICRCRDVSVAHGPNGQRAFVILTPPNLVHASTSMKPRGRRHAGNSDFCRVCIGHHDDVAQHGCAVYLPQANLVCWMKLGSLGCVCKHHYEPLIA